LADVFLLPSELESFGLAALEAMACGVPTVATRVGGIPELITHEVDGYLESPGDIAAQASRVTALLTDESLHRRFSEAARATAVTKFCSSRVIPLYERYYREICDKT
jgi:glycosyltransferase involved in cell wall biosynthesis